MKRQDLSNGVIRISSETKQKPKFGLNVDSSKDIDSIGGAIREKERSCNSFSNPEYAQSEAQ